MDVHSVDWEKMEWTPVRPGIQRKAFSGDGATLALHLLQPGHETRPHSHPHEQIVYIMSGLVDFHIGDSVVRLGPGGVAKIPGDVIHYAEVIGDQPVLNLDIFTPARPEYA
ncbi:cupin domain-containing protein [Rhizobium leguminosarum]|uniref:Cupin 2 domain-containing protein n=1 Tax=Rhizobium leguminosarum TaxID=384 RepID=A0A2K9ZCF6_RHILE|nr:cupin domain-containing protein [Rhizobium leguminosarum]AUW45933.1 Cupin 2 domain-containing protein [Rhizobium leguminosarum]TBC86602.1 cupin domain-containing protein [Rhizobium leguminosarum]